MRIAVLFLRGSNKNGLQRRVVLTPFCLPADCFLSAGSFKTGNLNDARVKARTEVPESRDDKRTASDEGGVRISGARVLSGWRGRG
jgi:hypothetical protein